HARRVARATRTQSWRHPERSAAQNQGDTFCCVSTAAVTSVADDEWSEFSLNELCRQDRQLVEPRTDEARSRKYLSLEHVESQTGRILASNGANDEGGSTTFAFGSRHVLYGKLRPYLNKVALPDSSGRCTTELIPLLPNERLIRREFLAFL